MRIEEEVKLDYRDVLIRPKRSTLKSRSEVSLERKFNFRNYQPRFEDAIEDWHYRGIPIMAANMDGVATFDMADTLARQGLFTCLVKTYTVDELVGYFNLEPAGLYRSDYVAMSSKAANDKHFGGLKEYRTSEGREVLIPYKGDVNVTIQDILGGIRSSCTYVGADKLKNLSKCTTFIRCNDTHNRVFEGMGK
jgi:IMP dehydrogenase/GMP reductase